MGRSNMASLKIILLPLAICLLLSLNSQVSGKPSPKHFLIETKEKAKKNNDYTLDVTNVGGKIGGIGDGSVNSGDYTGNVKNVGGKIGGIGDRSVNSGDYMTIGTANNQGTITENNNHYHGYWGKNKKNPGRQAGHCNLHCIILFILS